MKHKSTSKKLNITNKLQPIGQKKLDRKLPLQIVVGAQSGRNKWKHSCAGPVRLLMDQHVIASC